MSTFDLVFFGVLVALTILPAWFSMKLDDRRWRPRRGGEPRAPTPKGDFDRYLREARRRT